MKLHLVIGIAEWLPSGSYRFIPARPELKAEIPGDLQQAIALAAPSQCWSARMRRE